MRDGDAIRGLNSLLFYQPSVAYLRLFSKISQLDISYSNEQFKIDNHVRIKVANGVIGVLRDKEAYIFSTNRIIGRKFIEIARDINFMRSMVEIIMPPYDINSGLGQDPKLLLNRVRLK